MTKRILRLTASPHAISAGVAAGVLASFTPFLGFHFMIAFVVAYIIGGNFLAAATGTFFGNPLTFPFIWAATYKVGNLILSGESKEGINNGLSELEQVRFWDHGISGFADKLIGIWEPILKPMVIGSVPLGVIMAIIAYLITRWGSRVFKASRKRRLAANLEKNQAKSV